jgi:hypothetical protein
MQEVAVLAFIYENFEHVLCALLLVSRVGDLATTYLATPNLVLEANPVARRFGWPFGLLTLAACLLPYYDAGLAVMALVVFLLVCASNASQVFLIRTVGEQAYFAFLLDVAKRGKLTHALAGIAASSGFVGLTAGAVFILYPDSREWGFYIAFGILVRAIGMLIHGSFFTVRLFRRAKAELNAAP